MDKLFFFFALLGLVAALGFLLLQSMGTVVPALRLSCPEARGILVPQPGIEPISPALESRFLTTRPPGKFLNIFFFFKRKSYNDPCGAKSLFKSASPSPSPKGISQPALPPEAQGGTREMFNLLLFQPGSLSVLTCVNLHE